MGFEYQHVKFSTLQPPWSRGRVRFRQHLHRHPERAANGNTGRAQFLLTPTACHDWRGRLITSAALDRAGQQQHYASNISLTDNGKNYYGSYINDDWKVTPKLTVNLGLRWDFFGLVYEHHGEPGQFVPGGPPTGSADVHDPGRDRIRRTSSLRSFTCLAGARWHRTVQSRNKYGKGLGKSQKDELCPAIRFCLSGHPKACCARRIWDFLQRI